MFVIYYFLVYIQIDKQELPADPTITPTNSPITLGGSGTGRVTPSSSDTQAGKPVHPVQPTVKQSSGYGSGSQATSGAGYTQPHVHSRGGDGPGEYM